MKNEILYSTKFLDLKVYTKEDGHKWVYAHRPNAKDVVVIIPVVKKEDGEYILFLITKRPPIFSENKGIFGLETPAGLVGDLNENENILDAIKRELKEETGYIADEIKIVSRKLSSSAGATSETSTLAIAYIDSSKTYETAKDDDGGIIVGRKLVKKENVFDFIKEFEEQNNVIGAQTLSGLFYYFFGK